MPEPTAPAASAAPQSGTSSTPTTEAAPSPAPSAPAVAATPVAATPATEAPTPAAVAESSATATEGATPEATPDKTAAPAALFVLPEDMTMAPEAVTSFEAALRPKLNASGKLELSPQEAVDLYADQARGAAKLWQAQILAQNTAWEAESKTRFSPAQLAAAETGVGFLSSFSPGFRDLAKEFKNHPEFVSAMRVVGERLSEDSFEIAGHAPAAARRSTADLLYGKRKGN